MALGTILKWGAAAAGAVLAYKYVAKPWLARRAARKLVVVKGKVSPAERNLKEAISVIASRLSQLKVNAHVEAGTFSGVRAVSVKPDNRGLVQRLRDLLPDDVAGVPVVVV